MRPKITIIGAGRVGGATAQILLYKDLTDIVLLDIIEGLPQGKALDLLESSPIEGFKSKIIGTNSYEETRDSDIVIVAAGVARKPGMSRDDLLEINTNIVKSVTEKAIKYSPKCILIIVTNPLDAMVYVAHKVSKFPKNRVIGMAGVLDTSRFKTFIAEELKVDVQKIDTLVIGSHGDEMVPLVGHTKMDEKPISKLLSKEKIDKLIERTRKGGAEIIQLSGATLYGPASSIVEMVISILKDEKKVLPCAALLEGEYGVNDCFIGVPVRLGRNGVEEVIELKLSEEEKNKFETAVEHVKLLCNKVDSLLG